MVLNCPAPSCETVSTSHPLSHSVWGWGAAAGFGPAVTRLKVKVKTHCPGLVTRLSGRSVSLSRPGVDDTLTRVLVDPEELVARPSGDDWLAYATAAAKAGGHAPTDSAEKSAFAGVVASFADKFDGLAKEAKGEGRDVATGYAKRLREQLKPPAKAGG